MKKLTYLLLMALVPAFLLTGCGEGENNGNGGSGDGTEIEIDNDDQSQNIYADETGVSGGIVFTTKGAWTSSITEKSTSRAEVPGWVSIDPDHGDKADTYTINIILENNYSGVDRTAEITIRCGDSSITISVTQKATDKDGNVPVAEIPKLITKVSEEYVGSGVQKDYQPFSIDFKYDNRTYELAEMHIYDNDYYEYGYERSFQYSYAIMGEIRIKKDEYYTYTGKLNDKGYVTETTDEYRSYRYIYDGNDCLTQINEDGYPEYYYIWKSGNLMGVLSSYDYDNEGGIVEDPYLFSSETNDKTNIDLNVLLFEMLSYSNNISYDTYLGETHLFALVDKAGKRSKNYIIGKKKADYGYPEIRNDLYTELTVPAVGSITSSFYSREFEETGAYTFDPDGYPVTFTRKSEVTKYVYTYNGEREYVQPSSEYEREEWTARYGEGPWFRIITDLKTSTGNDTHNIKITYNK